MGTFKESLIIPRDIFEHLQQENATKPQKINDDTSSIFSSKSKNLNKTQGIGSTALAKIGFHEKSERDRANGIKNIKDSIVDLTKLKTNDSNNTTVTNNQIEDLLSFFTVTNRPKVRYLLKFLQQQQKERFNWNDHYQMIIDKKLCEDSNLIEILNFLYQEDLPKAYLSAQNVWIRAVDSDDEKMFTDIPVPSHLGIFLKFLHETAGVNDLRVFNFNQENVNLFNRFQWKVKHLTAQQQETIKNNRKSFIQMEFPDDQEEEEEEEDGDDNEKDEEFVDAYDFSKDFPPGYHYETKTKTKIPLFEQFKNVPSHLMFHQLPSSSLFTSASSTSTTTTTTPAPPLPSSSSVSTTTATSTSSTAPIPSTSTDTSLSTQPSPNTNPDISSSTLPTPSASADTNLDTQPTLSSSDNKTNPSSKSNTDSSIVINPTPDTTHGTSKETDKSNQNPIPQSNDNHTQRKNIIAPAKLNFILTPSEDKSKDAHDHRHKSNNDITAPTDNILSSTPMSTKAQSVSSTSSSSSSSFNDIATTKPPSHPSKDNKVKEKKKDKLEFNFRVGSQLGLPAEQVKQLLTRINPVVNLGPKIKSSDKNYTQYVDDGKRKRKTSGAEVIIGNLEEEKSPKIKNSKKKLKLDEEKQVSKSRRPKATRKASPYPRRDRRQVQHFQSGHGDISINSDDDNQYLIIPKSCVVKQIILEEK